MKAINYTDLRKNLSHYLDSVAEHSDKVVIPRSGTNGVILMSLDEYDSMVETAYLSTPAMLRAVKEAERSLTDGKGVTLHSHEEIDEFIKQIESGADDEDEI
jgi:antitoxin YefM